MPAVSNAGVKIMSTNLMLPQDDLPVVWRGPVVSNAVKQFYSEVKWDELDYLFVDMPPGTSDVLLTVFQALPIQGIVTVSAPQELVGMIVGKAVHVAQEMNVPVLGLVENMSYFICDECDKKHYIFGEPKGKEICEKYSIDAFSSLPMDNNFTKFCDAGQIDKYDVGDNLIEITNCLENLDEQN